MRLSAAILMLALPVTAAAAEDPAPSRAIVAKNPLRCGYDNDTVQYRPGTLTTQSLGEMPPAARLNAVYRTVHGCPVPVVLERGIGANRDKQLPITRNRLSPTPLQR